MTDTITLWPGDALTVTIPHPETRASTLHINVSENGWGAVIDPNLDGPLHGVIHGPRIHNDEGAVAAPPPGPAARERAADAAAAVLAMLATDLWDRLLELSHQLSVVAEGIRGAGLSDCDGIDLAYEMRRLSGTAENLTAITHAEVIEAASHLPVRGLDYGTEQPDQR
jgi:hypothetical protein